MGLESMRVFFQKYLSMAFMLFSSFLLRLRTSSLTILLSLWHSATSNIAMLKIFQQQYSQILEQKLKAWGTVYITMTTKIGLSLISGITVANVAVLVIMISAAFLVCVSPTVSVIRVN